jgi:hypothetical protein
LHSREPEFATHKRQLSVYHALYFWSALAERSGDNALTSETNACVIRCRQSQSAAAPCLSAHSIGSTVTAPRGFVYNNKHANRGKRRTPSGNQPQAIDVNLRVWKTDPVQHILNSCVMNGRFYEFDQLLICRLLALIRRRFHASLPHFKRRLV